MNDKKNNNTLHISLITDERTEKVKLMQDNGLNVSQLVRNFLDKCPVSVDIYESVYRRDNS